MHILSFSGKTETKRLFRRPRYRWEDNIKMAKGAWDFQISHLVTFPDRTDISPCGEFW